MLQDIREMRRLMDYWYYYALANGAPEHVKREYADSEWVLWLLIATLTFR